MYNVKYHIFVCLRLTRLDMSNNRLSVIPTTFLRFAPNLEELLLDNNILETLVLEVSSRKY